MMRNRYIGVILLVALGLTVSQQLYSREIADDDEVFRIQNQLRRELIAIKGMLKIYKTFTNSFS